MSGSVTAACCLCGLNITELAATTIVALLIDLLLLRTAGYNGEAVRQREGDSNPRYRISVCAAPVSSHPRCLRMPIRWRF
jgi:hypothetical protein